MRNAQVANEFLVLVGVLMIIAMLILSNHATDVANISTKKELLAIRDVGTSVQNEIFLASRVKDGYHREFTINHSDVNFSINIVKENIIIISEKHYIEQVFFIPNVTGNVHKGINVIERWDGGIYLNQ